MNSPAKIGPKLHAFMTEDRIRLFTERNEFKRLAEQRETELTEIQLRSNQVISILLVLNVVLIGVLAYVLCHS